MAQTSDSASAPYATAADLIARYDVREVGMLARDDGRQSTYNDLLADPNLAAALADASGDVELACAAGKRYTTADLQALTGNAAALLRRLVCDIAFQHLRERRGRADQQASPQWQRAQDTLKALRDGAEILPFLESEDAGLPLSSQFTESDYERAGLLTNNRRAFGLRNAHRPSW